MSTKRPSLPSLLLGLIPFIGMCFTVPLWDRVEPMVLGIPFNLAWLLGWIFASSLCLSIAYRIETRREAKDRDAA